MISSQNRLRSYQFWKRLSCEMNSFFSKLWWKPKYEKNKPRKFSLESQTCSQIVFKASPSENNFPFPVLSETDPRNPKAVDTSKSYLHSSPVEVRRVQIAWTNWARWPSNSSPYFVAYIATFSQIWAFKISWGPALTGLLILFYF